MVKIRMVLMMMIVMVVLMMMMRRRRKALFQILGRSNAKDTQRLC